MNEHIMFIEAGKTRVLHTKGKYCDKDIVVTAEGADGKPIEIDALDNALLVAENDGKVYKYDDKLYQVHKITSLKGLTIKFNEYITPCPVIGEDDEFECSGVIMGDDDFGGDVNFNPTVTAIKKTNDSYMGTAIIAFIASENGLRYISAGNQEDSGWYVIDYSGNEFEAYAPAVIYKFDCPALNENPVFIEWVFANAKVYPHFETASDIKSFKLSHPFLYGFNLLGYAFTTFYMEATSNMYDGVYDFGGHYTASFSLNGEIITKTFTNAIAEFTNGCVRILTFSDGENSLTIGEDKYDEQGMLIGADISYNNIVLQDEVTFTAFNGTYNGYEIAESFSFLSFILCYTTVSGEYLYSCEWVEYVPVTEAEEKEYISFLLWATATSKSFSFVAVEGMTFAEWFNSQYNDCMTEMENVTETTFDCWLTHPSNGDVYSIRITASPDTVINNHTPYRYNQID